MCGEELLLTVLSDSWAWGLSFAYNAQGLPVVDFACHVVPAMHLMFWRPPMLSWTWLLCCRRPSNGWRWKIGPIPTGPLAKLTNFFLILLRFAVMEYLDEPVQWLQHHFSRRVQYHQYRICLLTFILFETRIDRRSPIISRNASIVLRYDTAWHD